MSWASCLWNHQNVVGKWQKRDGLSLLSKFQCVWPPTIEASCPKRKEFVSWSVLPLTNGIWIDRREQPKQAPLLVYPTKTTCIFWNIVILALTSRRTGCQRSFGERDLSIWTQISGLANTSPLCSFSPSSLHSTMRTYSLLVSRHVGKARIWIYVFGKVGIWIPLSSISESWVNIFRDGWHLLHPL